MAKRKREIKAPASGSSGAPAPSPAWQEGETDLPLSPAGRPAAAPAAPGGTGKGFLNRDLRENVLLVVLILYVLLLGLGTAGELFELDWILSLPLFR